MTSRADVNRIRFHECVFCKQAKENSLRGFCVEIHADDGFTVTTGKSQTDTTRVYKEHWCNDVIDDSKITFFYCKLFFVRWQGIGTSAVCRIRSSYPGIKCD